MRRNTYVVDVHLQEQEDATPSVRRQSQKYHRHAPKQVTDNGIYNQAAIPASSRRCQFHGTTQGHADSFKGSSGKKTHMGTRFRKHQSSSPSATLLPTQQTGATPCAAAQTHRRRVDVRLEGIVRVGQGGQSKRHDVGVGVGGVRGEWVASVEREGGGGKREELGRQGGKRDGRWQRGVAEWRRYCTVLEDTADRAVRREQSCARDQPAGGCGVRGVSH